MRAAFHNLGCKVNEYETEAMKQLLLEEGYNVVPFDEPADVYVVNTCTVTQIADRKSRQMLHKARQKNPEAVIVAAGCYVQEAKDQLLADGTVDIAIGNNEKSRLPEILKSFLLMPDNNRDFVPDIDHERLYEDMQLERPLDRTRAFVKIQDGCNQFCSYCLIPFARGRVRSRRPEEVMKEVETLGANGVKEIIISGIHVSSYGLDFISDKPIRTPEASENFTNEALLDLLRKINAMPGIARIRLGSLEPGIMTEDFVKGIAACDKICPQFHLSLQSGSEATLKRMNRRYTPAEYADGVRRLREAFDNPAITTDIIAGFAGETEEEFAETYAFAKMINFAKTHVFKFSRRRRTRAWSLPDQVPEKLKAERSAKLIALDDVNKEAYAASFLGKEVEVLFEETAVVNGETLWKGHSRENIVVYHAGEGNLENEILTLKAEHLLPGGELKA
ncbi:MAG: tRNA (N(6)-L-threonylcarbamoyladenosine(37)-C(2))-methylthiotransferase MtaB [Lachnospiraceae bacterium]|nr:tRNA (N(6)-L-threonylcarbamoyladenosine(37)-C(2))-methylthiotransferase MtaB [Lachnospiraceae bacterium]